MAPKFLHVLKSGYINDFKFTNDPTEGHLNYVRPVIAPIHLIIGAKHNITDSSIRGKKIKIYYFQTLCEVRETLKNFGCCPVESSNLETWERAGEYIYILDASS
jgi:hypothetical protein